MNYAEFKTRMDRIAEKNNDDFKVTMTKDENGYSVEVVETADSYPLMCVSGPTESDCLQMAANAIPKALEHWGYKE